MATPDDDSEIRRGPSIATEDGLRAAVRSGLRWSFGTQLTLRALSFASGIVIFRLLDPADFGVYALALAVSNVMLCLNDLGQEIAVVAWSDDDEDIHRTATTVTIATSLLLFVACWLLAPLIAESAGRPSAAGVIRLMAGLVVIDGFITVPRGDPLPGDAPAAGERHRARPQSPRRIAISVTLAVLWPGPWAPVIGTFVGAVVNAVVTLHYAPAIPVPGFVPSHARRLLAFGVPGAGTTTLDMILLNVDTFIVANHLGVEALGFYALAFNVSSWPAMIITTSLRKVSVAAINQLIRLGGDWRGSFVRSMSMLIALLVPICLLLALLAEPLVELLYSAKSLPAAPILVWLVVLGGMRVVYGFVVDLLMAHGRTVATFRAELLLADRRRSRHVDRRGGRRRPRRGDRSRAGRRAGSGPDLRLRHLRAGRSTCGRSPGGSSAPPSAPSRRSASSHRGWPRLDRPVAQLLIGGAVISVVYGVVGLGRAQLRSFAAMVRGQRWLATVRMTLTPPSPRLPSTGPGIGSRPGGKGNTCGFWCSVPASAAWS